MRGKVCCCVVLAAISSACGNEQPAVAPAASGSGGAPVGLAGATMGGAGQGGSAGSAAGGGGTGNEQGGTAGAAGAPAGGGGDGSGGQPTQPASPNWPQFGRDLSNSRASDDTTITAADVASLRVAQRVTGTGVSSTPAVVDGTVYFSDFSGRLKAVNAITGAVIWDTLVQRTQDVGGNGGMLPSSPLVTADTVYTAGNVGWVYAVDRTTGMVKWRKQVESRLHSRIWSSPTIVDDKLIIGAASYQVFFPVSSPADQIFRGSVKGLKASTGDLLWSASVCEPANCGSGVSVWSSAGADRELKLAFIGTGQTYSVPAGPLADALVAIRYEIGEIAWAQQFASGDVYNIDTPFGTPTGKDHDIGAAPNLFSATIAGVMKQLVGVGGKDGTYRAFERATGTPVWSTDFEYASPIGGVMLAPAVSGGFIYAVNNTGIDGTGRGDARPRSSTAFAVEAATGNIAWRTNLPAGGFGGISVAGGLMYFMTWDGQLRVVDTKDGKLLKTLPVGAVVGTYRDAPIAGFPDGSASGPVVSEGRIYVGYGWTWGATVTGGLAILETDATPE